MRKHKIHIAKKKMWVTKVKVIAEFKELLTHNIETIADNMGVQEWETKKKEFEKGVGGRTEDVLRLILDLIKMIIEIPIISRYW